jgi:hypothetical protein
MFTVNSIFKGAEPQTEEVTKQLAAGPKFESARQETKSTRV